MVDIHLISYLALQDTLPANNRIRCALCHKESNIGERGAQRSAVMYIGLGLACIVVCLGLMATTMGLRHNAGYWYIYLSKFLRDRTFPMKYKLQHAVCGNKLLINVSLCSSTGSSYPADPAWPPLPVHAA